MYKRLVNSPFVNISVHIVSMKLSSLHHMCGWLGWFVGWLTWGNLDDQLCASIFPASTLHWLRGASCLAGVHVCVCTGGTVVPTPEEGTESFSANCYLLGKVCPALPGLETTTARSCHQSADVVGEIYTETLKKQKYPGKNRIIIA